MDRIDAARLLVRLAERGSFSAAARDLRIKQSTASKWIAELERQMGVTLVERTTRALHLTDAGRLFQARATEMLASFDALSSELSERTPTPTGRVRLSVPVVFGRLFVVPQLAPFLSHHPQIEAEVVLDDRYVNLVEERFDLTIRVGLPVDTTSRGRKLAESRRVLVASPAYVKARGKPGAPRDLERHDCILHGAATTAAIWRFTRAGAKARPVSVHARVSVNNSEAALELARGGLGVALLADWLVSADLSRRRLVRLLPDCEAPSAAVYALTPPGPYTPSAVRALLEHLASAIPEAMRRATPP